MAGLEELEFAQVPIVVEFLHVEEFTGVNHGFHHHVLHAAFRGKFDDGLAILHRGSHRNGTGHVLARAHGLQGRLGMMRDRGVDVNGIDIGIFKQLRVIGESLDDTVLVGDLVQVLLVALAQGHDLGVGMALIDRDELGSKAEANDGDSWCFDTHG